jgi:phage portal protein BeeE
MGLLSRVMASTVDVMTSADLAKLLGRSWTTKGGAAVSYDSAMQVADVYKCVRILSEDMAKLPLQVYRRTRRGRAGPITGCRGCSTRRTHGRPVSSSAR